MFTLTGKCAIVTGGCSGIGYAICKELLQQNIKHLAIFDIHPNEEAIDLLRKEFPNIITVFVKMNVCDKVEVDRAFRSIKNLFGQIHIVVNAAGMANELDIEQTLNVNVAGVIFCSLKALELMDKGKRAEGGVIINIASMLGLGSCYTLPVYCATKFAVVGFTRSMGNQKIESKTGVKFMVVCPGVTETPLNQSTADPSKKHWFLDETPGEAFKNYPVQKSSVVAKCVVEAVTKDKNRSVWVSDNSRNKEVVLDEQWGLDQTYAEP